MSYKLSLYIHFPFCRKKRLAELVEAKYLEYTPPYWRLTDKGMLIADAIARKLI